MLTAFAQWLPPVAEESRKCRLTYHPIYYNSVAMIENKTVFILGAGASCPYGYPSGKGLRMEICSQFCQRYKGYILNDPKLKPDLEGKLIKAREFTEIFHKATTKSIDLFLSVNSEFEEIGKTAIALSIFGTEKNSHFREHVKKEEHDWYSYIFHKLTDGLTNKNDYIHFGENRVSFITFNYDRSLEYFLYDSLIHYFYKISPDKIKEQLIKLRIIHVFGQVAGLEWQDLPNKIEYRHDVNLINIQVLVKNLRIIYEEEENPELEEAHKLIREAQHIYFLGFGYAKENLKLLKIPEILNPKQNIYGTALGSTPKEKQDIQSIFSEIIQSGRINIEGMDCLAYLRHNM